MVPKLEKLQNGHMSRSKVIRWCELPLYYLQYAQHRAHWELFKEGVSGSIPFWKWVKRNIKTKGKHTMNSAAQQDKALF